MDEKLKKIQKLLDSAEADIHTARGLMRDVMELGDNNPLDVKGKAKDLSIIEEGKVVEGVFNGLSMVGADGKEYPVPANYASKSKLIEGDTLKLTIGDDGSFMYKQIAPTERRKIIGILSQNDGNFSVNAEGKNYKVLQASITYYKGEPGDQVTIIIPKDHDSSWSAVENVIKKEPQMSGEEQGVDTQPNNMIKKGSSSFVNNPLIEKTTSLPSEVQERGETFQATETKTEIPSEKKEELSSKDQILINNLKPQNINNNNTAVIGDDSKVQEVGPPAVEEQVAETEIKELEI